VFRGRGGAGIGGKLPEGGECHSDSMALPKKSQKTKKRNHDSSKKRRGMPTDKGVERPRRE